MTEQYTIRDTAAQDVKLEQATNSRSKLIWGVGAVFLLMFMSWMVPSLMRLLNSERTISRQQLQIATVELGNLQRDIAVQGKVIAAVSPTLFAHSSGTVSLHFKAGDEVQLGDIIATIASPEIESEHQQQKTLLEELDLEFRRQEIIIKTELLANQQKIELAEVDYVLATKNKVRADINIKNKVISQVEYEQKQAELEKMQLQQKHAIENAKLQKENFEFELQAKSFQLDRQKHVVKESQRKVNQLNMRSPITGTIGNVLVREKDAVAKNAAILTVVDLTQFELEVNIPETFADDLGVGLAASIFLDNSTFAGELTAIAPEVTNGQVIGRIKFTQQPPNRLRQNQRVSVRVLIESRNNVLKVQRGSFVETSGGNYVFVIEDDIAIKRQVQLGARSISEIEIISGVSAGEEIIISSVEQFADIQQIYLSK